MFEQFEVFCCQGAGVVVSICRAWRRQPLGMGWLFSDS